MSARFVMNRTTLPLLVGQWKGEFPTTLVLYYIRSGIRSDKQPAIADRIRNQGIKSTIIRLDSPQALSDTQRQIVTSYHNNNNAEIICYFCLRAKHRNKIKIFSSLSVLKTRN